MELRIAERFSWVLGLANAKSYNNDDRSWRVAGLAWAGTNKAATAKAMRELLAAQRRMGLVDLPRWKARRSHGKSLRRCTAGRWSLIRRTSAG